MRHVLLAALVACGADEVPAAQSETERPVQAEQAVNEASPEDPQDPSASWVELLHALPGTWVSTSSAHRNDPRQVGRLVDGDLETAWSSFSDVGNASIFVRVPDGAVIHAIELTVGYTKMHGQRDLFTGNRRINRVRLLEPSHATLQEASLDPESRELQRIVFEQPFAGGDLEIALAGFVPGSNDDWNELCVSELRVLGEGPSAQPDSRTPMSFLGTLPPRDPPAQAQRILDRVRGAAENTPTDLGQPVRFFSGVLYDAVATTLELRVSGGACYTVVGEGRQRLPDDPNAHPYDVRAKLGERVWSNDATPEIVIGLDSDEICPETAQSLEIRVAPGTLASYWLQVFSRPDPAT